MGVRIWINKGHIYLSLCYGGKQWREGTGLSVPKTKALQKEVLKLAEEMRAKKELEMAAKKAGLPVPGERPVTLYEYAEKKGLKPAVLSKLEESGGKDKPLAAVTREWLLLFQSALLAKKLSRASVETYCVHVRGLLHKAVLEGLIDKSPYDTIPHVKTDAKPRVALTAEEVRKLRGTPCPWFEGEEIKRAFLFSCLTGLRVSDIVSLRQEDMDRAAMMIRKRQVKTRGAVYVPLSPSALALAGEGDPPFPYLAGLRDPVRTNRILGRWGKAAGIAKPVTWHIARHTAATLLLEAGADIYTVQHILGHSKVSTTQVYAEVSGRAKREAVDGLEALLTETGGV